MDLFNFYRENYLNPKKVEENNKNKFTSLIKNSYKIGNILGKIMSGAKK